MPIDGNTDVGDLVGRRLFVTGECGAAIPVDSGQLPLPSSLYVSCRKLGYLRLSLFSRKWLGSGGGRPQNQIITPSTAKGRISGITDEKTLFICLDGGNFGVVAPPAERRDAHRLESNCEAALETLVNIPGNQESASKPIM